MASDVCEVFLFGGKEGNTSLRCRSLSSTMNNDISLTFPLSELIFSEPPHADTQK